MRFYSNVQIRSSKRLVDSTSDKVERLLHGLQWLLKQTIASHSKMSSLVSAFMIRRLRLNCLLDV